MKTCSQCSRDLPITSFHMKGRGYRRPECKDCFKSRRPRVGNVSAAGISSSDKAAYQRYYKYGLTEQDFARMLEAQGGQCAICEGTDPRASDWQVDHDHATGRIRGLLCRPCNVALGLLSDDVGRIERAISYLNGARSHVAV